MRFGASRSRYRAVGEAFLVALAAGLVGLAPGILLGWFLFYRLQR